VLLRRCDGVILAERLAALDPVWTIARSRGHPLPSSRRASSLAIVSERTTSPATHDLDAVVDQALAWHRAGRKVALATVARTWGSSPRPAGSKLAVNDAAEFVGSVSGGCIEGAVIQEALEVMATGVSRVLAFGVSDETAWEVGLACGGKVEVFVEAVAPEVGRGITRAVLGELVEARRAKRSVVLVTPLDGGAHRLVPVDPLPRAGEPETPAPAASARAASAGDPLTDSMAEVARRDQVKPVEAALAADAAQVARRDQAQVIDALGGALLLEPHNAPLRLIIVGAVHVAQPLAEMAALSGFAVTIVDPRRAFATAARFPGQALVVGWPDVALAELRPDARTAVVTLTHDPKLDDPALVTALGSPAFYVGCLGSKKTHAARRVRLGAEGVGEAALDRLHGPIGMRISARTPPEIAISILAEIIAALRGAL
jgi:xanthine/CO dehydrogenase XdhC/CoxF family maturation factor